MKAGLSVLVKVILPERADDSLFREALTFTVLLPEPYSVSTVRNFLASVSKTATETDDAAHISEQDRLNFTVRYCAETQVITSSGYRIMFNGKIYNIDSIDCMNYKKKSLKFTAHLVER